MSKTNPANTPATTDHMKIDEKVIKRIIGESIVHVPGVLGVEGGFADVLKPDNDITKGISITVSPDKKASVSAKIITEYGKNIPAIVNEIVTNITEALQNMAGITAEKVEIEVADTKTLEEYTAQNRKFYE